MADTNRIALAATATALVGTAAAFWFTLQPKKAAAIKDSPAFLSDPLVGPSLIDVLEPQLDRMGNESLIKIVRQLDFWYNEPLEHDALVALAHRLVHTATWQARGDAKVPKVRFGRTELAMPVVTVGCMRFQSTWMPDFLPRPLKLNRAQVLSSDCQSNVLDCVRQCLAVGMNHFETARFYGTSEYQLMHALRTLMEAGELQRTDFILQTKLPVSKTSDNFKKYFAQSWQHFAKLGYIDLLTFWCVSTEEQIEWALDESSTSCMAAAKEWQAEGKIRHIGVSTHSTGEGVMHLVASDRFAYVNLHCHFFGDYHAAGTSDTVGGQGNLAAVKKALELDMGVFGISPYDKGGRTYQPSAVMARTIGPELSPNAFVALHLWATAGVHTISLGLARPSDLDETLEATALLVKKDFVALHAAEKRLQARAVETLGEEWVAKGLLNLPSCLEESTDGIAIGHVLWLHNLMTAYGMYEFCRKRYKSLEDTKWKDGKSFAENKKKMASSNIGRAFSDKVDLSKALEKHFDREEVKRKLAECHAWLTGANAPTEEEKKDRGWDTAYDLRAWPEYPDTDRMSMKGLFLQNLSGGRMGMGGGPTDEFAAYASQVRTLIQTGQAQ